MADTKERPDQVLVILAHPDDPEFFCGATIARWTTEGREVVYCLLTRGDKGSDELGTNPRELARTREREQRSAAEILGVKEVIFLDFLDGHIVPNPELRKEITRIIRQVRPDIVLTSDPGVYYSDFINHSDHRAAGQATLDSLWPAARSAMYYPELSEEEGLEPIKVHQVYIAGASRPNTTIDVTGFVEQKLSALAEHRSQIKDLKALRERLLARMRDPNSPPEYPRYVEKFHRLELS